MGRVEKEESTDPYWVSSTNWFIADGSLEGAITLLTSSSNDEDADKIPIPVLLEMPADSPPCEITISFREKHEIRSIYVRSTARIYEIYYASDKKVSSNEYLCTVRCVAAVTEDINTVLPWSDSNNSTEDGWVEIKVPDSLLQENRIVPQSNLSEGDSFPKLQIHYEATAEISDSSPCLSVTLRLLSLQNKTSVQIEEIYVFSVLVEDNDPDPPACNTGAGYLLSMLVPGLLDLSRSRNHQINEEGFSDAAVVSKFSSSSDKPIDVSLPDMLGISEVGTSSMIGSSKVDFDPYRVSKLKLYENSGAHDCAEKAFDEPIPKDTQTKPAEVEKRSDQSQKAKINETNDACVRHGKILDDLVSRMEKIENFCLSFQESVLKPLTGIDMRLQRMEKQLDTFFKAAQLSSVADPSSRSSCPSEHNSNIEYEACIPLSSVGRPSSHEKATAIDELPVSLPETPNCSGLVVKAPEFLDDEDVENCDYESTINDNFVDLTPMECFKNDTPLSIDSALASALAAFITSTTERSYVHKPHPMDVPTEQQMIDKHFVDSSHALVLSVVEQVLGDRNCDLPYDTQDKTSPSDKSSCDVHDPDGTLKFFDTFHTTDAEMQRDCFCDVSLLYGDDSSAEVHAYETKGLILRQQDILYEGDISNCNKISDSRVSGYLDAQSHALSNYGSTLPSALFISSGNASPYKISLNAHDDDPLESSFDDIFIKSKLHHECSESSDLSSYTVSVPVTCQPNGSSQTLDAINQFSSHYELKQELNVIPSQDDLPSNINFNVDETLKSWLPLEVLLGEKTDVVVYNGEDLLYSSEFHVNRDFITGLPPEVPDGQSDDQIKSSDCPNDTGIDQRSEIVENTLLDFTCNVDQYQISGILEAGTPVSPVCLSNEHPFSSLI